MAPGATTNPHNVAHTPGGSSSGSGAAVADFMVPAAFGTQTGGSVLRPASYCGVFGFKPTFGAFNRSGVYPAAESLDTLGLIARSLDDIELLSAVLELRPPQATSARSMRRPASGSAARPLEHGTAGDGDRDRGRGATAATRPARGCGRCVLPDEFAGLRNAARETINNYERAAAMAHEWNNHRERISDGCANASRAVAPWPHADYVAACGSAKSAAPGCRPFSKRWMCY